MIGYSSVSERCYCMDCLICGEGVPLSSPLDKGPKICNKCKGAVMYVRRQFLGDTSKPAGDEVTG